MQPSRNIPIKSMAYEYSNFPTALLEYDLNAYFIMYRSLSMNPSEDTCISAVATNLVVSPVTFTHLQWATGEESSTSLCKSCYKQPSPFGYTPSFQSTYSHHLYLKLLH